MRRIAAVSPVSVALVVVLVTSAHAQALPPSPEQKRLGFLVGTWKIDSEARANPFYPTGTYPGTMVCEWFNGNYHIVCSYDWQGAAGPYRELDIFGFDSETKDYFAYVVDGTGFNGVAKGTVKDKTWTFVYDLTAGGKPMGIRWSPVEVSPTAITWKSEYSQGNGPWLPLGEARATKVK